MTGILKPLVELFKYIVESKRRVFAMLLLICIVEGYFFNLRNVELRTDLQEYKKECKSDKKEAKAKIDSLTYIASGDAQNMRKQIEEINEYHTNRYDKLNNEFKDYVKSTNAEYKAISKGWERDYRALLKRVEKVDHTTKVIKQKVEL